MTRLGSIVKRAWPQSIWQAGSSNAAVMQRNKVTGGLQPQDERFQGSDAGHVPQVPGASDVTEDMYVISRLQLAFWHCLMHIKALCKASVIVIHGLP